MPVHVYRHRRCRVPEDHLHPRKADELPGRQVGGANVTLAYRPFARHYAPRVESTPWVVVLTGAPGAGKSSTARALGRATGAAVLDQDAMTNPLVDVVAELVGARDYDDPRLAGLVRTARYACLLRVAADCVGAGVPVVLVAPFTAERRDPAAWSHLADAVVAFGGKPHLVWLRITSANLAERLQGRAAARDAVKLSALEAYVAGLDLSAPAAPFVEVDASTSPVDQAAQIWSAVS